MNPATAALWPRASGAVAEGEAEGLAAGSGSEACEQAASSTPAARLMSTASTAPVRRSIILGPLMGQIARVTWAGRRRRVEELARDVAVAAGVLLEVVLVVVLGGRVVGERAALDRDGVRVLLLQSRQRPGDHGLVGGVRVVDAGAVLGAVVVALPVDGRGLDGVVEQLEQERQRRHLRVVDDLDGLRVAAAVTVAGRGLGAVGVADLGGDDALHEADVLLQAPEAAAGHVDRLRAGRDRLRGLSRGVRGRGGAGRVRAAGGQHQRQDRDGERDGEQPCCGTKLTRHDVPPHPRMPQTRAGSTRRPTPRGSSG